MHGKANTDHSFPISTVNKEKSSTYLTRGQPDGDIPSIEVLTTQMTLECIKLTNQPTN